MPYAIFTDYSGVTHREDGRFATRREALEALVAHLVQRKKDTAVNLQIARTALAREMRKSTKGEQDAQQDPKDPA